MPETPYCFRRNIKVLLPWLAMLSFFLSSCFFGGQEKQSGKDKSVVEKSTALDSFRLSQLTVPHNAAYSSVLEDFDKNDLQNIDRALTIFTNNKADSIGRDSMLITFNEFMASVMQEYYDRKLIGNHELIERFRNREDQSEARKFAASLALHGINILFRDGEFYLEPDMSFVYNHLKEVLTAGSRDYLQTRIYVAGEALSGRNQQVSAPDSLASQVLAWEDFMVKNPGYLLKDEIQSQYLDVLSAYLSGTEQLPLFDPVTKMLDPKYQASYLHYTEAYPNRESTKVVKKIYDLLASKGFKYSEELDTILSEVSFLPNQSPQ